MASICSCFIHGMCSFLLVHIAKYPFLVYLLRSSSHFWFIHACWFCHSLLRDLPSHCWGIVVERVGCFVLVIQGWFIATTREHNVIDIIVKYCLCYIILLLTKSCNGWNPDTVMSTVLYSILETLWTFVFYFYLYRLCSGNLLASHLAVFKFNPNISLRVGIVSSI